MALALNNLRRLIYHEQRKQTNLNLIALHILLLLKNFQYLAFELSKLLDIITFIKNFQKIWPLKFKKKKNYT